MLANLIRLERGLIIFFCMALALLMVVQLILRYVFATPFLGLKKRRFCVASGSIS